MARRFAYLTLVALIAAAALTTAAVLAQTNGAANQAPVPTPRTADGKPDLTGVWGGGGGGGGREAETDAAGNLSELFPSRRCAPNQVKCGDYTNQSEDGEFTARLSTNRPIYRPEFWDKVQELDMWTNKYDPIFLCQPDGIPRAGAPTRIIQTPRDIVLFYNGGEYRIIPTDGRKFDPIKSQDVFFWGHSVGRWEGDTLVIDSIAFNDLTWFGKGGYFHSDKMTATERFSRDGNTLRYEVTVNDPEVLAEPWTVAPRVMRINPNPDAGLLPEPTPCRDYDSANMVTQIRH